MKRIIYLFLIVIGSSLAFANDATELFQQGNEYYRNAEYDSALTYYQRILDSGVTSPELYYNLGNTYYKKGMIGETILYYERALRLAPGDEEIRQNLEIAKANTIDKIDPLPQIFYKRWINEVKNSVSPDTWAVTSIVLLWLFFASLTVYVLSRITSIRKLFFSSAVIFLIFFVTSAVIAYDRYETVTGGNSAIIFEASVYIKSSPDEKSTDLFLLHEGTKVEILDELSEWRKIKIANGSIGWINQDAIRVI